MSTKSILLGATLAAVACTATDSLIPTDLEDAPRSGKADGSNEAVVRTPANEALFSQTLKNQICSAIGSPVASQCDTLNYTVTEFASSTEYFRDDGDPVTMQLRVTVEDEEDREWNAVLTRQVDADFKLRFNVRIFGAGVGATQQFIAQAANAAGEFPDLTSDPFRVIDFDELPAPVLATSDALLAERSEGLEPFMGSSEYGDDGDAAFAEIVMNGEVVGYAISLWDHVDHPLWDGSGTTLYIDVNGHLVVDMDWEG